jgi:hypothetical protein
MYDACQLNRKQESVYGLEMSSHVQYKLCDKTEGSPTYVTPDQGIRHVAQCTLQEPAHIDATSCGTVARFISDGKSFEECNVTIVPVWVAKDIKSGPSGTMLGPYVEMHAVFAYRAFVSYDELLMVYNRCLSGTVAEANRQCE